jgi:hypothetical protein
VKNPSFENREFGDRAKTFFDFNNMRIAAMPKISG